MSLSSTDELLTTMFAVHGKRPMDAQFNEYLKIMDKLGYDNAKRLFEHVRDEEDKFPTIKQMWGIINSMGLIKKRQEQLESYDDCYFCGGVGYVPRMLSPKRDPRVTSYNTEVYACRCSAGQSLPSTLPRYFNVYDKLQFEETRDGLNYPQLVSRLQIEYNNKLHEESTDDDNRRNKKHRAERRVGELREKLEEITGFGNANEIKQ